MVGGTIKDFFYKVAGNYYLVKFLVEENKDTCTVRAEVPKGAIDYGLIKIGQSIWWQSPLVFIKIDETPDVSFRKIGNSGGNEKSYYEEKSSQIKPAL